VTDKRSAATARTIMLFLACAAVACAAVACAGGRHPKATSPARVDSVLSIRVDTESIPGARPAHLDLGGSWATGSANEPTTRQITVNTPCNHTPAAWITEQAGDTVRAWTFPPSEGRGVASGPAVLPVPAVGRLSGLNLTMTGPSVRYVLRYDSTSGHLRGTLNGAAFWAVRQQIARPAGCIPPP
jgi:hypothetical protein